MAKEFEVTEEKLKAISKKFSVPLEAVRIVHTMFVDAISGVKNQYLAHIIRCIEAYCRDATRNPMFQINCFPLDKDSPILNVGCAQYFPKRFFSVFFHPGMEEKQLRVCLAHELGHLFIIELLNERELEKGKTYDQTTLTEPISSIFGVFTIMEKNDFYQEHIQSLKHKSWDDIVEDFVHLQDRTLNS
jgi:Zn-dependent peptidase ImmA (M78 family)